MKTKGLTFLIKVYSLDQMSNVHKDLDLPFSLLLLTCDKTVTSNKINYNRSTFEWSIILTKHSNHYWRAMVCYLYMLIVWVCSFLLVCLYVWVKIEDKADRRLFNRSAIVTNLRNIKSRTKINGTTNGNNRSVAVRCSAASLAVLLSSNSLTSVEPEAKAMTTRTNGDAEEIPPSKKMRLLSKETAKDLLTRHSGTP